MSNVARITVKLGLQDAYDNAREMEAMWNAAAESLTESASVCDHPIERRIDADGSVPAICLDCDRVVPAWALRRDGLIS